MQEGKEGKEVGDMKLCEVCLGPGARDDALTAQRWHESGRVEAAPVTVPVPRRRRRRAREEKTRRYTRLTTFVTLRVFRLSGSVRFDCLFCFST